MKPLENVSQSRPVPTREKLGGQCGSEPLSKPSKRSFRSVVKGALVWIGMQGIFPGAVTFIVSRWLKHD